MLHICLHLSVTELAADETLGVEDSVDWVHRDLVLRRIANETLGVGERDIGGCGAVTLVIGNNFHSVVLPDTDTSREKQGQNRSRRGRSTYDKRTYE